MDDVDGHTALFIVVQNRVVYVCKIIMNLFRTFCTHTVSGMTNVIIFFFYKQFSFVCTKHKSKSRRVFKNKLFKKKKH